MVETVNIDVTVPLATGVTEIGAMPQVTVGVTGETAQVNPTKELNPFKEATVIVEVVEFPAVVVAKAGDALRLKSLTVKVKFTVRS